MAMVKQIRGDHMWPLWKWGQEVRARGSGRGQRRLQAAVAAAGQVDRMLLYLIKEK